MGKYIFDESDLDDETVLYIDKYFKKVIINAKKQYLNRLAKDTKIILNYMEELRINESDFYGIEDLTYEEFKIDNMSVRIYNETLLNTHAIIRAGSFASATVLQPTVRIRLTRLFRSL